MLNSSPHLLRYGTHSEKELFLEQSADVAFDAVVINANMLAYTTKAMATFALRLSKPFFIDPQTHAFQHGFEFVTNKNGGLKQSIKNLASFYGEPIAGALEQGRSINASDFSNTSSLEGFVKRVVSLQLDKITEVVTSGSEAEYINFALDNSVDGGISKENITPNAVVAPYFFVDDNDEIALDLNKRFVNEVSKIMASDNRRMPVVAQLILSKTALRNSSFIERVVEVYGAAPLEAVFLWIDEFDETDTSLELLQSFRSLVENLSQKGKSVFNLYGGYFSILLTKIQNGLSGVCHGMEYGESRKVVPVGGGLPRAKYYFPPLHKRLRAEDFQRIVNTKSGWSEGSKNSDFAKEVCSCKQCCNLDQFAETQTYEIKSQKGTSRRGETSTTAAKEHSLAHYLLNKTKEYSFVRDNTIEVLLADLKNAYDKYSPVAKADASHLTRWIEALSSK